VPIERARAGTSNGHNTIRRRGAYRHVLGIVCERDASAAADNYLLLDVSQIPAWEKANAQRMAALMRERSGEELSAQSYMLPPNLPIPFDNWPRGCQRSFSVTCDDVITLRTMGAFE
jgi:hypothetical protein